MQPFPVICETCHARLKVRSEDVIGHILACPKCGSMVEIAPPADWLPPSAEPPSTSGETLDSPPSTARHDLSHPLVLWASGGAALVLVATLVGVLLTRGNAEPSEAARAPTAPGKSTPATVENSVEDEPAAEALSASEEPSAEPIDATIAETPPSAVDEASIAETVEAIVAPRAAAPPADTEPPSLTAPSDPLDFRAATLTLGGSEVSPEEVQPPHRPTIDPEPPTPHTSPLAPPSPVRLGPVSTGALTSQDVDEQLAVPIESLDFQRVPLARLLGMLSDMAAVPITLDPDALTMAGISASEEVTVHSRGTTIGALLTDVLAKHGLAYEQRGGGLAVVKPNADRVRSVDYEVKDLVGPGDSEATQVADLVRRFVAPSSWQTEAPTHSIEVMGTSLRVRQTDQVHYQILTFCERLRLARNLPTRSRYPVERLTVEPVYQSLESQLAGSATFTFLPWTPLAEVFGHLQAATGTTVLVDWSALAELELAPSTPVACSIHDRPWHEALDAVLEPLGLTWWAVDDRTIQITSRDAVDHKLQIEFYPVADDALDQYGDPAAFVEAMRQELDERPDTAQHRDTRVLDLEFDARSQHLIVLGPPEAHRLVSRRLSESEPTLD